MKSFLSPAILGLSFLSSLSLPEHVLAFFSVPGVPTLRPATLSGRDRNNGIHLAVSPVCGPLSGNVSDVNAGIDIKRIKTIVAFGDSYTDGGRDDGGPLAPPVVVPPDAEAGGRSTDGKVWIEDIAEDIGATLKDYAQSGACTDLSMWPSAIKKVDFLGQMQTFLNQSNHLDPDTTLYAIFFGINDYEDSKTDGTANLQAAAKVILNQISILASPPTNARSFLVTDVYGRGTHTPEGDAMVQTIFSGLAELRANASASSKTKLNFAFAEFARIWDGVLDGDPGYKAFGYVSTDACIVDCTIEECTTDDMCDDPDHYFYYIPGHPSKEGHRIMADYVQEVLQRCVEE
ncbi:Carbohydrate Esterase Family 16 protein [Trametes cinnabarina]|uniref:Carbohydrate Esterase Family 16 protein n=1 Tax=Pycnoporus cinnabarinus TaxID=5643 RepID=A0A060SP82_PYCCI|nr:Carbohydrate Esterase Family 16 protein [Trametes cinnabarina]